MNSFGFITLVALSVVVSCSGYYRTLSPITLCMKSDYSWCTNVTYPNGCVNMDTVFMNSTGNNNNNNNNNGNNNGTGNNSGGTGSVTALKTIESVIVADVESTENKCVVLFDTFNCQGHYIVLNGTKHPSTVLSDFGFSNRAESYRQCTDRVLSWLRDNSENQ